MVQAGTGVFQVGSRIAVLVKPGDEFASLEVTPEKGTEGGRSASAGKGKVDVSATNATWPKGESQNGDGLAYLGRINETYLNELEGRIHKLGKLDLTNIKIA